MMLTFFISMRLVNRNNCLASKQAKQASKQASKPSKQASKQANPDLLYIRRAGMRRISSAYRPGVFALGAWEKGHPTNTTR
ncbi:MAG: hypothetical protein ACLTUI_04470 [Parabacteroides distasonis]